MGVGEASEARFEGHHQPNVPAWGYTDEKDPKIMKKKIQTAVEYGIDVLSSIGTITTASLF